MNEKFNSQVCTTKEQSQRLLDLGLKPETADMCWLSISDVPSSIGYIDLEKVADELKFNIIPAWSLHRLIELLDSPLIELSCNPYEEIIYNISECVKYGYLNQDYLKQ